MQAFIANNSQAAAYHAALILQGDYILQQAVAAAPAHGDTNILVNARSLLNRVYILALLYRLSGNDTYAARTAAEILSATRCRPGFLEGTIPEVWPLLLLLFPASSTHTHIFHNTGIRCIFNIRYYVICITIL